MALAQVLARKPDMLLTSTLHAPARIGKTSWSRDDMVAELPTFAAIYAQRPVRDNHGGMSSAHLFCLWFLLRQLQPATVIESGVFQGQGTWLIEQAVPNADLICIDIDWSKLVYRSTKATYVSTDFSKQDWSAIDKNRTFAFFDDHMNAVERTLLCARLGFKHIAFEDNYFPETEGDVYSLKLALAERGYAPKRDLRYWGSRLKGTRSDVPVRANPDDAEKLRGVMATYAEMPPIFLPEISRWERPYSELPTEPPLLNTVEHDWQAIFADEAAWYTWLCYVELS